MNSTNIRSTRSIPTMPMSRISATATRTGTTRTTRSVGGLSADSYDASHVDFSSEELVVALLDCRRSKRNTFNALAFEQDQECNLVRLHQELAYETYKPGRSICFVAKRPKPREIWAAEFRDRIVHHLIYNKIAARFQSSFIADTCACISRRGTLDAARRLEAKIRSITQNWSRPAYYLKCDFANFFVSIDKRILREQLAARVHEPWWMRLTELVLMHDPRADYDLRASAEDMALVPAHKQLANQPAHRGLPIGNLSSQFFANVRLDPLDQFIKHQLRARYYVRYVDDFVLLHDSPVWLNTALDRIQEFLSRTTDVKLNPTKTVLQPIARGVDFVGHVIKPFCTLTRRRTVDEAVRRIRTMDAADVYQSANSYQGLLRQSPQSHTDLARLAKAILSRGYCVNKSLTKTYRKKEA